MIGIVGARGSDGWMGGDARLPFPTKRIVIRGVECEEYIIPANRRKAVLKDLYPFIPVPSLDQECIDIHTDKRFKVREYRVIREGNMNVLVSPYYEEGGGTVIDWWAVDEDDDG